MLSKSWVRVIDLLIFTAVCWVVAIGGYFLSLVHWLGGPIWLIVSIIYSLAGLCFLFIALGWIWKIVSKPHLAK